jgi:hypothetical protein
MEKDLAVILELLEKKGSEGLHWYKLNRLIEITDYSFASGSTLGQLTEKLLELDLMKIAGTNGLPDSYWFITNKGKQWLADKSYFGALADELLSNLAKLLE